MYGTIPIRTKLSFFQLLVNAHLEENDRQANEMMERLTAQMAQAEGVTEQLKAQDQMAWVRAMNNIKKRAEEIVINDLIFA